MMTKEQSLQLLSDLIEQVRNAETDDFLILAEIAGLNPLQDFSGIDLSGVDLRSKNMARADLIEATLIRASLISVASIKFSYTRCIPRRTMLS